MSKLVRINLSTEKNIDDLIKITGKSQQNIIEHAIEDYIKKAFIKKANEETERFKKEDPKGWAEYMQEMEEWDITFLDGLNDD